VLQFLLHYLKEKIEDNEGKEKNQQFKSFVNEVLHQTSRSLNSKKFRQNLASMVMNNENMGLSQQVVVLLEAYIHLWREHEFQACILKNMGSSDESLMALQLYAIMDLERNGVKKSRYFKLYLRIIVPALAILIPMVLDLSSDSALTASYYSDFSNDTLTNSCITSSISQEPLKWETYSNCISPLERFLTTLVPIVLPFIYFLSEAITYWFKKHEKDTEMTIGQKIGFYCKIVLSCMLWPAFIVVQIAYYTKKKLIDRENTDDIIRSFDLMYIDAHIIEVCFESSLQPLLQLYLLMIHFLGEDWEKMELSQLSLQQILQIYSFLSSILAIAMAFASNYSMRKEGMMDMGGRIVYILYVLFSVLSRILCLELFAISLGPGKFSWIYFFLAIHLVLIFLINVGFQKWLKNDKEKTCGNFWTFREILLQFQRTLSNLYIHYPDYRPQLDSNQNDSVDSEDKGYLISEVIIHIC